MSECTKASTLGCDGSNPFPRSKIHTLSARRFFKNYIVYNWTPLPSDLVVVTQRPGNGYMVESQLFQMAGDLICSDIRFTPEWDRSEYPKEMEAGLVNVCIAMDQALFIQWVVQHILGNPNYSLPLIVQNRRMIASRQWFDMSFLISGISQINRPVACK